MRWPPMFQLVTDAVRVQHVQRVVDDILDQEPETPFALEQIPLLLLVFSEHLPLPNRLKRSFDI